MSKKIILASNNKGKIREISDMLTPLGYEVVSMRDAGIDMDIEETGTTFRENAAIKARAVHELAHCAVIADDSGLTVEQLGGAPGVYSHRFAGENATDEDRNNKLLHELEGVPEEKRGAAFVCSMCFIDEDGSESFAEGKVTGMIGFEPRGKNGFGYDPLFMYGDRSFAELSEDEKNNVSHRANALKELYRLLKGKTNAKQ